MIDFRYHLVSLVAVFMALAVGIVLGAGPLGQEISSTLEAQVKELREERNGLRAQLDQAESREQLKDQAVRIATPALTADRLTGRRVGLVTMPGADRNVVGQVQDNLSSAGASVVLIVRLTDAWQDPENQATRHEAASELAPEVADPDPREGAEPTTETVLAATLAGLDETTSSGAWRMASERLEELGFYSTNWSDSESAEFSAAPDTFVIVTGDLVVQEVEEDEDGTPRLEQALDLVAAFGALDVPTLVAGYGTESFADPVQAAESPIIRGIRAESAIAETVATVDNVEGSLGQLATVLGLRWMIEGEAGHWGVGTDAVAPLPNIPDPLSSERDTELLDPLPTGSSGEDAGTGGATEPVGPIAPVLPDDAEVTSTAPTTPAS